MRIMLLRISQETHVLQITRHHIITDIRSTKIFWQELSAIYNARVAGGSHRLPLVALQYADFAVWQREWLQGETLERELQYWRAQLCDSQPLNLPTDRPHPPAISYHGAKEGFILASAHVAALREMGIAESATMFMALLSVFYVLLFRYTQQEDISIGTPITNRNRSDLEGVMGLFLNTLVLRARPDGEMNFRQLLCHIRALTLQAYQHQELPFEKLVDELRLPRIPNRHPLFQTMFVFTQEREFAHVLEGLTVEGKHIETTSETAKFDLTLSFSEKGGRVHGLFNYATDLFDASTIRRMAGHFQTLLEGIVANPDTPISELPLLTEAERHQLLIEWNDTTAEYPREKCVHQLFEAQVERTPDAIALSFDEEAITYCQLNARANQLAHHLIKLGVEPAVKVGICVERSIEMVVGLLAIIKAGGVYLPLDPTYPRERLAFMLADTQASFVVTKTALQSTLPAGIAKFICLDKLPATTPQSSCDPIIQSPCHPDDPAYIIYTSGSTGQPKGAIVPHRQILNRLWWMWRKYPFAADEMSCQKTALNFVDSLWELLGPLLQGSPTVIVPDEVVRDPQRLVQSLARHGVTRLWLVPTLLRTMVQSVPDIGVRVPTLRFLVTSGEALPTELFQQVQNKLPHATLYNLYGTSEVWDATWYDPTIEQTPRGSTVPIGKPIDNVQAFILDQYHQPVPIGVTGELYIGGIGLADGYLNQPALTASRFVTLDFQLDESDGVENPKSNIQNLTLYRTGDLACYRADGNLEFLGRIDFQVKIRGFRIELSEIEVALQQHPAIYDAVVVVHQTENGNQQLAAYLIAASGETLTGLQLRQSLQNQLPAYMIPATYTWLEAFPLTSSGKVNRQALPTPILDRDAAVNTFSAASDVLEMQLVQIWEKTLHVQPIGIYDNFFDIGGHSLLAVTLFARIAKATGQSLPLSVLLQAPTIAQQAVLLQQQNWQSQWTSLRAVRAGGSRPPLFLVPPARGTALSFTKLAHHLDPDQPIYAFDPVGLDGSAEPLTSIEAMAAHYINEMRLLQPEGPYRLGGMCVGGHIAFEMAYQLCRQDQKVELLTLMDPPLPPNGPTWSAAPPPVKTPFYVGRLFIYHLRYGSLGRILRLKAKRMIHRFNQRVTLFEKIWQVQVQAQRRYRAHPYPGSIVLIQSTQNAQRPGSRTRWSELALGGLVYHLVPGTTHRSLIATNPAHVAQLAAHIEEHLYQLPATSRGSAN